MTTAKKRSLFHKLINVLIGTAVFFIALIILLLGYTQTKSFRDLLRDQIVNNVNKSINGKLSIDAIDGSVLTSLILRNAVLTSASGDTAASLEKLEVQVSPLQLLIKKIYVRKVLIQDTHINLIEDSEGNWNFATIFPSGEPEDITASSPFTFKIQVNDFRISNLSFCMQTYEKRGSRNSYPSMNLDDLLIDSLFFDTKFIAKLDNPDIQLVINHFSLKPNFNLFAINKLEGAFHITERFIDLKKFTLSTELSQINIDAHLDSVNIFESFSLTDFNRYPIKLNVEAEPFHFADLSTFIPATDLLKGNPQLSLSADGYFGNLNINSAKVNFGNSRFSLQGNIANLHEPENLLLDINVNNASTNYNDVLNLLPSLELPEFQNFDVDNYEIKFYGSPTNFDASFAGRLDEKSLIINSKLNFDAEPATYDIKFQTKELNLKPFTEIKSSLTGSGSLKGKGFSPEELANTLRLELNRSKFNGYEIDSLRLTASSASKVIYLILMIDVNNSLNYVSGNLDLTDVNAPAYKISGSTENLNLASFTNDSSFSSSLNFAFEAEGRHFDIDSISGRFSLDFTGSAFQDKLFDDAIIELEAKSDTSGRKILFGSNFLDFNINGNFSLQDAIDLLVYQGKVTSKIIAEKIDELNPVISTDEITTVETDQEIPQTITDREINFDFDFEIKNFDLLSKIFQMEEFGIAGSGDGLVKNNASNFTVNTSVDLDYFYTVNNEEIIYFSDLNLGVNFSRDNRFEEFDKLFGALSLSSERIISGVTINDFEGDIIFNQSKLFYNLFAEIDTSLKSSLQGMLELQPQKQLLTIDELSVDYKDLIWANTEPIILSLYSDSLSIDKFSVSRDSTVINLSGKFSGAGNQDLQVKVNKIPVSLLSYYLAGEMESGINAQGDLIIDVKGTISNPSASIKILFEDILIGKSNFGDFVCDINYFNNLARLDLRFLNIAKNYNEPVLRLSGTVPFNQNGSEADSEQINLKLVSDNFELKTLGDMIPTIKNPEGTLKSNVEIKGGFDQIEYFGDLSLRNFFFRSELNNLDYKAGLKLNLNSNVISVDSFIIANTGGSKRKGTMKGGGYLVLSENELQSADIYLDGNLAVLGQASRAVSPVIYGDLYMGSQNRWVLTYSGGKGKFSGTVLLKETDLILSPAQGGYSASANDISYEFLIDSSKIDQQQLKFDKLIKSRREKLNAETKDRLSDFAYDMNIRIESSAKLEFVLSQAFNQKLTVEADGDLRYETRDGIPTAQGEFRILNGSKLDFFKSFEASGSIRFEGEIADPYLDVLATYFSEYKNPNETNGTSQPVAVKIKIKSRFSELGQKLTATKDNIQVFIGARNIADNTPDPRYGAVDAVSFILVGQFVRDGLDSGGRESIAQNVAQNTADSFLGQTLTSLVNSEVGDVINDIRLSTVGQYTRFNVSGRIKNIRYSLGGTEEVFQNINKANLRIEYLFNPNFLIRIERKDPIILSTNLDEKINELGLKYIFIF